MIKENVAASLEQLIAELRRKNWTLGAAESCTGGLLSSQITAMAGVSDVYMGGVVSYANAVKENLLQVPLATLQAHGAVSGETALAMVRGARAALRVDCAIAITGIAGPTGGSPQKPVGTVFVAVAGPHFEMVELHRFAGVRTEIQQQSANCAVRLMLNQLLNGTH